MKIRTACLISKLDCCRLFVFLSFFLSSMTFITVIVAIISSPSLHFTGMPCEFKYTLEYQLDLSHISSISDGTNIVGTMGYLWLIVGVSIYGLNFENITPTSTCRNIVWVHDWYREMVQSYATPWNSYTLSWTFSSQISTFLEKLVSGFLKI